MEPTLTPPDPADDPLEALLRAAPQPIPDDGFTARVCAALPPRGSRAPNAARWLVLSAALALGCLLSWVVWSSIDPTLVDFIGGWKLELWQAFVVVILVSAWAIGRDEPEGIVIGLR